MATPRRARPLSPHLQIYRLPLTAVLSILHRITGVALSVGLLLLIYWLTALAAGPQAYQSAQAILGSWLGLLVLFGFSVGLFYHLCSGIRHLFWDGCLGLDLKTSEFTARLVVVATVVLTLVAWGLGFAL